MMPPVLFLKRLHQTTWTRPLFVEHLHDSFQKSRLLSLIIGHGTANLTDNLI
jgi:hypothetical protein